MWVKANGYVFQSDEVIAVGPLEPVSSDCNSPPDETSEARTKVILRAGFEFELRGGAARRFREMFLEGLAGGVHDHDSVQVNDTRVLVSEKDPVGRPVGRPS
jgi:hypothetical protein